MTFADLSPLANHIWQSTLFAAVAWLLTLALRKNRAAMRYWLWLAASVKFLIPFSLLLSAGAHLGWRAAPAIAHSQLSFAMGEISQPFAIPAPMPESAAATPPLNPLPALPFGGWLCGIAIGIGFWVRWWRQMRAVLRVATPLDLNLPIRGMSSPARMEPGVIGIFKPFLLLPEAITEHLTPAQLEGILAHELRHVQRRDNLTGAIHMLVETIFWFHPLVWWIRTRLMEERERACDEEVMRMGREPQVYAESILKVCEFYLASASPCAAGVTGGELKKRIEGIMANEFVRNLSYGKKIVLASAAILAAAGPGVFGGIGSPVGQARAQKAQATTARAAGPSFEVASVKLSDPKAAAQPANVRERGRVGVGGRFDMPRINLTYLVMRAFDVESRQISGPNWMNEQPYDVFATAPAAESSAQIPLMFQNLLAERFKMKYHLEDPVTRVYALVVTPGGSKVKAGQPDDDPHNYGQIATKAAAGGPPTASARTSQYGVYRLRMAREGE